MDMRFLILLLISQVTFGQNKKEQIELLTIKLDSTEKAHVSQMNVMRDSLTLLKGQNAQLGKREKALNLELDESRKLIKKQQFSLDSIQKANQGVKVLKLDQSKKYAGKYEYQVGEGEDARIGSLQMYCNNDGLYYFTLEYNIGAPSFNMGMLTGTFKVYGDRSVFEANVNQYYSNDNSNEEVERCLIIFSFDESGVFVNQLTSDAACGFGGNVIIKDYFIHVDTVNKPFETEDLIQSTNNW